MTVNHLRLGFGLGADVALSVARARLAYLDSSVYRDHGMLTAEAREKYEGIQRSRTRSYIYLSRDVDSVRQNMH